MELIRLIYEHPIITVILLLILFEGVEGIIHRIKE